MRALPPKITVALTAVADSIFRWLPGGAWGGDVRAARWLLLRHFQGIGVGATPYRVSRARRRYRERHEVTVLRRRLAFRLDLSLIDALELWQVSTTAQEQAQPVSELTFVVRLKPGVSLERVPLLTSATARPEGAGLRLEWWGFEWGRLPLLVDRLRADTRLNNCLAHHLQDDFPQRLRITALSEKALGITTPYDPQRLPSRQLLDCYETIAAHACAYIADLNRARAEQEHGPAPSATGGQPHPPRQRG